MNIFEVGLYETLPLTYQSLFLILGAALGSFFNVLALRWPEYQKNKNDSDTNAWLKLRGIKLNSSFTPISSDLMAGRSRCPKCHSNIPIYLNIPIISWLYLCGKSACCKTKIDFRYIAFELYGLIVFLIVAATIGPSMAGLFVGTIIMVLTLIALIDLKESIIPDQLLAALFLLSYTFSTSTFGIGIANSFEYHAITLISLLAVIYLIEKIRGGPGMGTSDVHLMALGASLVGPYTLFMFALLIPLILTTHIVIKTEIVKPGLFAQLVGKKAIPAGPAICAAIVILLAFRLSPYG